VDTDGNFLGDEWELAFFGQLGNDPFAILAGDGYTTLQKYLDGKDPLVFGSYGANPPADLGVPVIHLEAGVPGTLNLLMPWPSAYFGAFKFTIQRSSNLADPLGWVTVATSFAPAGPDNYVANVPYAGGIGFWRVLVELQ
jgi:hypothetical protein